MKMYCVVIKYPNNRFGLLNSALFYHESDAKDLIRNSKKKDRILKKGGFIVIDIEYQICETEVKIKKVA